MSATLRSAAQQSEAKQRLIFALDVASLAEVKEYVALLKDDVGLFKVGKQLFLHGGPQVVRLIQRKGGRVFLDLKFHDIPRTVANASVEAARLGVRMLNLHAAGGLRMMQETVAAVNKTCKTERLQRPTLLAVTVLTSLDKGDLKSIGVGATVENQVARLATLARDAGMDGVVASPLEIARLRRECGEQFLLVVPGVRSPGDAWDDQKRVLTPEEAVRAGANYLVIGKPIRDARDPRVAARLIVQEMTQGLVTNQRSTSSVGRVSAA
ncbi:MAG: orotidine-5'-phosphate decarboxylase [Deltaproteobacteria bacterium]|nr:orotidine-5'-phosphate decarboxylase [Deltaproteobacteria bacterium]